MTYLAILDEYTITDKDFTVIELLTESKSLYIINPILTKKGFVLINNLSNHRNRGFEIVCRRESIYYYIVDGDNDKMKRYVREFKINKIMTR